MTYEMGATVLTNGPCTDCAFGQGDCRDVQVSALVIGSEPACFRIWCLNCGAYVDTFLEGLTLKDFEPYRQAAA